MRQKPKTSHGRRNLHGNATGWSDEDRARFDEMLRTWFAPVPPEPAPEPEPDEPDPDADPDREPAPTS